MSQFGHLAKLSVDQDATANYEFINIKGKPCLKVLPATESNKGYFNIMLKNSRKRRNLKNINVDLVASNREDDRALYPKHMIRGWSNVQDTNGKDVAYTEENVKEFLDAIPDYMFDDLREFCSEPSNFTPESLEQDEDLVKNSAPALTGSSKSKTKAGQ